MLFDLVIRMSVGNEQIEISIVVIVEKLYSPSAHEPCHASKPHWLSQIVKRKVMIAVVDGIHLLVNIGYKEVLPAVLIEIGRIDSHARAGSPILAVGNTGFESHLLKFSATLIDEQKICHGIVCNEEIHPTVVVHVSGDNSPGLS